MMRTYAGHSTAKASNELYRGNLAKGQTGLSVAFDLPTQTGYDPDDELARGEVGKVGVPVVHRGDMATLMDGIPLGEMNTSMTINATAAWLLALYIVAAEDQGVAQEQLQGTTQNDIIKEFLARGTYAFPPAPSMRLIADMIAYTVEHVPKWNPINICSYHLQEAGATPVQEIAYAMSQRDRRARRGARARRSRPRRDETAAQELMGQVFGRISFFVNAGVRFVEEHAKLRAMGILWEELGRERYGVTDPKHLRFRYGVQVNSLGLTEAQPENNVQRIVLETLAVTLGRDARARAVQLPAWNEALGLPRPWDQQWSLRIQQVMAYETDLLEYPDIFEGSHVMDGLVAELLDGARAEMAVVAEHGGAVEAVPYMKGALVDSHRRRIHRIESGEQTVVGQNRFTETAVSPLTDDAEGGILVVDPAVEAEQIEAVRRWRSERDQAAVDAALADLARVAARERLAREPDDPDDRRRARGRHHGRVGAHAARGVRLLPRPHRRRRGQRARNAGRGSDGAARGGLAAAGAARPPAEDPRRQARPRRPLQRRRADRRARPRLRHGRGLRRDSPDPRPDRRLGAAGGRARDRPVDPLRLPPRADPRRDRRAARGRRDGARGRRRDHPRPGRRAAEARRGGLRLHAQGLRPHADHARHRGVGGHRATVAAPRAQRQRSAAWRRRRLPNGSGAGSSAPRGVSDDGAALGARLRERDLSAAPAALNLLESATAEDRQQSAALLREVSPQALGGEAPGHVIGITGPPGAGKSTLLSALLHAWRDGGPPTRTVAMLAVDPSSRRSGGALLGDRARIEFDAADRGVLIRSTAAGERLGGLAWPTRAAAHALAAAFDVVVIETVGVGQAETEIVDVADTVAVVVQPGSGDALQFLKSGIMEIPDVLVVTKADLGQLAVRTRRDLSASLRSLGSRSTRVLAVSSLPPPQGIEELVAALDEHRAGLDLPARRLRARRASALAEYTHEHGERGLRALGGRRAAEALLAAQEPGLGVPALVAALERRIEADDGA